MLSKSPARRGTMPLNFPQRRLRLWQIVLSLSAFVLCLTLASCMSGRQPSPPCYLPSKPQLVLPEVGHYHKKLDEILQTESMQK